MALFYRRERKITSVNAAWKWFCACVNAALFHHIIRLYILLLRLFIVFVTLNFSFLVKDKNIVADKAFVSCVVLFPICTVVIVLYICYFCIFLLFEGYEIDSKNSLLKEIMNLKNSHLPICNSSDKYNYIHYNFLPPNNFFK